MAKAKEVKEERAKEVQERQQGREMRKHEKDFFATVSTELEKMKSTGEEEVYEYKPKEDDETDVAFAEAYNALNASFKKPIKKKDR